jgi:quercetin dioxygenase-like cupin family protein
VNVIALKVSVHPPRATRKGSAMLAGVSFEGRFGGSGRGFALPAGGGSLIELPGWTYRVKVAASDTAGALTVLEGTMDPGHRGPLEHVHVGHDEAFFVLGGSLRFRVGAGYRDVVPGETVFASRGLAHGFSNAGAEPARYLAMLSPSGYEFYFERLAALIRKHGSMPERSALLALMAEHGTFPVDAEGALVTG